MSHRLSSLQILLDPDSDIVATVKAESELKMATMMSVPVALVGIEGQCSNIIEVDSDSMTTLSTFQRQLAIGLSKHGRLLDNLKFRGNAVTGDSRLHHFAADNARNPRFTANFTAISVKSAKQLHFVKFGSGRVVSLIYRGAKPVLQLKRQLEKKFDIPADQQRLLLNGKLLGDGKTLQASGVQIGSIVHLQLPIKGGLSTPPFKFADVTNAAALKAITLDAEAPSWRCVNVGLNLEGHCQNKACEAFQDLTIDPVGLVSFSIKADKARCPACKTQFEPTTCGFLDCCWMYDGRKVGEHGPEDVSSMWQVAKGPMYYLFKGAKNTIDWYSLVLSARPSGVLGGAAKGQNKQAECTICWEPLLTATTGASARCTTACGHSFHAGCLQTWKSHMPTEGCPSCRQPV